MSDLMHIVDKLREAAMQAKRECDTQVEQVLTRMTKKIKDDITSHRDKLLQQRKTLVEQEEKEHVTQKQQVSGPCQKAHHAQLDANIKEFERLKRSLIELLETHKVKQKKMNHCKCLMLRDDETLVKVHHMLTGNDS
ncbi:hypothetical protein BBBOND_0306460 [Babesia bigemina]|uniref:Uncharacterized protein n=1 Tax=Babesia bigemina TaxID=5866 RepID=A0A061D9U4_BABBI|nr:hypothetical protein BBBOND_0306460 [Babesia bigemina]CDR96742.1 hypothetical protein BBBOND_0306460 [Babesia bigemina]|eukprot:XP_012768928.1 hypothetical protein BBBOND_0306460 [Babesia bigemina]